ncbi:MAG: ABC transporter permease [Acidimicrobiia bacterium]
MAITSIRFFEGQMRQYRRTWRSSVITTFVNPVLFLTAMGLGLGSLVNDGTGRVALDGITYVTFLAPGLLAATTMQTGAGDSSWPVMAGIKWVRSYEAALSTPIRTADIVFGHIGFVLFRVTFTASVFVLVMAVLASVTPPRAALSVLPAVLTGMAFATPIMAYTASRDGAEAMSSLFRFGIVPLFLFSGTFFPVSQLPDWMEPIAHATPLWHGVELTRAAALGVDTAIDPMWNVLYLSVWVVAGVALSLRVLGRRMIT